MLAFDPMSWKKEAKVPKDAEELSGAIERLAGAKSQEAGKKLEATCVSCQTSVKCSLLMEPHTQ